MSELIGIIGESGTGKSTSIRTLNPKETLIINCVGKPLPFKGWKSGYSKFTGKEGNYLSSDEATKIVTCMNLVSKERNDIKNIIIDD